MRRIVTSAGLLLLFLAVQLLILPICCYAEESQISDFVGPYYVRYNDSFSYSESIKENSCLVAKISDDKEHYSFAVFLYSRSEKNLMIVLEEDLGGAEKYLLENDNVSVGFSASDYTIVEKQQRIIAGYEGTIKIAQNKTWHTIRYGTFRLRSKTSCDDMTKGRLALVQISCLDCTKDGFDRILDTFEIERYLAPNNGGSYL